MVNSCSERVSVEVCIDENTIFVKNTEGQCVFRLIIAAIETESIFLSEGFAVCDGVQPTFIVGRYGVVPNQSGFRVDERIPSVVLERVVLLASERAAEFLPGSF